MFFLLKLIQPKIFAIFGVDDAIVGGAIAGLGSMAGGLFGANTSAAASKDIAKMQIDWDKERAKNAHQWEVEDLEKAGLNKVLTVNGQGAATGSINPPMPDTSGYNQAANSLATAINTTQQLYKTQEEIGQIKAQAANLDADSKLKGLQAITESYRKGLISANTAQLLSQSELNKLKYTSDKRWLDWERGSNVFKNISMPIISAIGAFGSLTKLKDLGRAMDKMSKNRGNTNIHNYYNNFAEL